MGKTAAGEILDRLGVCIIDTDQIARESVAPGQPAVAQIATVFGDGVLAQAGQINRGALAKIVFSDVAARKRLEEILHPLIRAEWKKRLENRATEGAPVSAVIIPLLFETDAGSEFDATLCIACREKTQYERLSRRGWSPVEIQQRISAQLPIEKKIAAADYVCWSEGPMEILETQLKAVLGKLKVS
jgi:dephospho-CoA kinase